MPPKRSVRNPDPLTNTSTFGESGRSNIANVENGSTKKSSKRSNNESSPSISPTRRPKQSKLMVPSSTPLVQHVIAKPSASKKVAVSSKSKRAVVPLPRPVSTSINTNQVQGTIVSE